MELDSHYCRVSSDHTVERARFKSMPQTVYDANTKDNLMNLYLDRFMHFSILSLQACHQLVFYYETGFDVKSKVRITSTASEES